MKKLSILLSLIIVTTCLIPFSGCGENGEVYLTTAFGSPVRIEVYDKPLTEEMINLINGELNFLEEGFSVNKPTSVLSKFNSSETSASTTPSQASVINTVVNLYQYADGRFNPAVYPLSKLWHFTKDTEVEKEDFTPPSDQEIQEILDSGATDFTQVSSLSYATFKMNPNIQLDFGGCLKGIAADRILSLLSASGYNSGYFSIGTSSMGLLAVEELSVRHPEKGSELLLKIDCSKDKNVSVSTSGNYEKYYDYEGVRYSHIIDPRTGKPSSTGVISATILANYGKFSYDTGAYADVMTTALCVCSFDPQNPNESELVKFMKQVVSYRPTSSIYVAYSKNGEKVLITNKEQGEDFTLLDSDYTILNI